jgi:dihydropteroate synthase
MEVFMLVRNLTDPLYNQTVFGVHFVNGVADMSDNQIQKLKAVGGFEWEIVKDECGNCKKVKEENIQLQKKIEKLNSDIDALNKKIKKQ